MALDLLGRLRMSTQMHWRQSWLDWKQPSTMTLRRCHNLPGTLCPSHQEAGMHAQIASNSCIALLTKVGKSA